MATRKKPAARKRKPQSKSRKRTTTAHKRRALAKQAAIAAGEPLIGGATGAYLPEFDQVARVMCEGGATDFELGRAFKVSERSVIAWRQRHPSFGAAAQVGKDVPDERVKRSLYQRAVGYDVTVEKIFNVGGKLVRVKVIEHIPPDPQCMFKWLHNRRPEEWRDQQHLKLTPPTQKELSDWELAKSILFGAEQQARAGQENGQ